MSSPLPDLTPPGEPSRCALCDSVLEPGATRCGSCGYHLAASSAQPFSARALVALGTLVAAFYLVALLVVLAAR